MADDPLERAIILRFLENTLWDAQSAKEHRRFRYSHDAIAFVEMLVTGMRETIVSIMQDFHTGQAVGCLDLGSLMKEM